MARDAPVLKYLRLQLPVHHFDKRAPPLPTDQVSFRRYYRQNLEQRLGKPFKDGQWQRWQALGRLAHILRLGFVVAYLITQAETEKEQKTWQRIVDSYNEPIRAAFKWL